MKINEAWLREWVDPDIDRTTLLEQLTMAGLEVESVQGVGGDCTGVVVGKVGTQTADQEVPQATTEDHVVTHATKDDIGATSAV